MCNHLSGKHNCEPGCSTLADQVIAFSAGADESTTAWAEKLHKTLPDQQPGKVEPPKSGKG